jgi:starvation-inducible DNA-binding protein
MSAASSEPMLHQHGPEVQEYGTVRLFPLGLSYEARMDSSQQLNHVPADTQILYSLYKKHHWLMRGPTFYQLHLLLDKHTARQLELIDVIAGRNGRTRRRRLRARHRLPPRGARRGQ